MMELAAGQHEDLATTTVQWSAVLLTLALSSIGFNQFHYCVFHSPQNATEQLISPTRDTAMQHVLNSELDIPRIIPHANK